MLEAEILKAPPMSGEYEEHDFSISGNTVWVKFLDSDYIEWCGVFSRGNSSFTGVIKCQNEHVFLVIAGGQGYFLDINTRKIISKTKWDNIESVIYNEATESFVISDGLYLAIMKDSDIVWISERISVEGISFLNINKQEVTGILNDLTDEWCNFKFNVVTREIDSNWLFYKAIK